MKRLLIIALIMCSICGIAQADITAWWPLDEETAPPVYNQINGTEGVLFGAPVPYAEAGPFGGGDYAYDFTGGIMGVHTTEAGVVPATGDFTVLAWIKTSNAHSTQGHVFSNNNGQGGRAALTVEDQKAAFWADGFQANNGPIFSTSSVDDNTWHEIGISRIDGTFYILVDGVAEDSVDLPDVSIDQDTTWMIGRARRYQFGFEGLIADVKVYDVGYDKIGYPAFDPAPGYAEEDVLTTVGLQWRAGLDPDNISQVNPAIKKHYLYGTFANPADPNLYLVATLDVGDTDYGDQAGEALNLTTDTVYYWMIEEGMDDGQGGVLPPGDPNNIAGARWTFTSIPSVPVITGEPQDVLLEQAGDAAVFSVTVESISAVSYQWYQSSDNANDTPDDDTPVADTPADDGDPAVLTIGAATLADEGFYYCEVSNASNQPVVSVVAKLAVKRQLAYWTLDQADFDGTYYLDKSTEDPTAHDADPNGTPAFTTGIAGDAVALDELNGWGSAGTWDPSGLSNQITLSAWVKWDGTTLAGDGPGIVSKRADGSLRWSLYARDGDGGHPGDVYVRFASWNGGDIWVGPNALVQDEWTHVAATVDAAGVGRVYVNGELRGSDSSWNFGTNIEAPIWLGRAYADQYTFPGAIDDVKIYNYALSDLGIAVEFTGLSGESVCVQSLKPDTLFDLNDDCIVNLEDFADYAASWMSCGLVPDCLP